MMMCLGKIYEHFHTEKYFEKNEFSILTDFPSAVEKVNSPKVTNVTKEVTPKKETSSSTQENPVQPVKDVKPKVVENEEKNDTNELLPKILAELEEMKRKYQLEVEKTKSLTEMYHKLQEEKVKKVYGSMQYIMVITFLVCVLAYFFK
jgi:phage gp29-like protein